MYRASALVATLFAFVGNRFEDRKDRGATAVEYGLLVGLIAVVIIAAVILAGEHLTALFDAVASKLGIAADKAAVTEAVTSGS